ncbi:MAG: DUF3137 domain-containing protein [Pseudomonadota bacterium]
MQMMDAVFTGLSNERPEFKNAMATWRDRLQPELAAREAERKAIIKRAIQRTIITVLVVMTVAIVGIVLFASGEFSFFLGALALMVSGVASAVAWMPLMAMKSETKQMVVGAAAEAFGFSYDTLHPDMKGVSDWRSAGAWIKAQGEAAQQKTAAVKLFGGGEDETPTPAFEVLKTANLLPSYDKRKFEDLIQGERAGAKFSLVECKLTEEQGSGKNRRTVTTFQGLLFHIAYPQRFLGRTIVARRGWSKGWFSKTNKDLERVELTSTELERAFNVFSNDQVEARFLLTPDRMERLIALERHFKGGKLRFIFEGDHLTLALEAKDQFEAGSIWQPLVNPERYTSALTEMGLVCDVIDGFLTREWVKDKL